MKKQTIVDVITGLLLLLFVYTGLSKLLTPDIMRMDLSKSEQPYLLYSLRNFLPYFVPLAELLVSALLLIPAYRKVGFYCAIALMGIFTIYVGYILFFFQGLQRPCTCGGIFRELTWPMHFVINLIFTGLATIGLILENRRNIVPKDRSLQTFDYSVSK